LFWFVYNSDGDESDGLFYWGLEFNVSVNMNIKSLFGLVIILVCQFFVTNAMLINRMTPKPDQGFQVQLNLTKNEPFWWGSQLIAPS
jgi:hypothetical protein